MVLTLQRVDAVVARLQAELPPTAKLETHRLTFAAFPIIGYSLTSDTVPPNKLMGDRNLRHKAAIEPAGWRRDGGHTRRARSGIPDHA